MPTYTQLKDGSLSDGRSTIPVDPRNAYYQRILKEVDDGFSTINPYQEDVEALRSEVITAIYGAAREVIAGFVNTIPGVDLVPGCLALYEHVYTQFSPAELSPEMISGFQNFGVARREIFRVNTMTLVELQAYDVNSIAWISP